LFEGSQTAFPLFGRKLYSRWKKGNLSREHSQRCCDSFSEEASRFEVFNQEKVDFPKKDWRISESTDEFSHRTRNRNPEWKYNSVFKSWFKRFCLS